MVEFSSAFLLRVRRRALRSRVWFRVLDSAERGILSLVPRCVEVVRSPELILAVARIVVKIEEALRSPLERFRSQVAKPLAVRISCLAQSWGYEGAEAWADDEAFIGCLAVNKFNDISLFR